MYHGVNNSESNTLSFIFEQRMTNSTIMLLRLRNLPSIQNIRKL